MYMIFCLSETELEFYKRDIDICIDVVDVDPPRRINNVYFSVKKTYFRPVMEIDINNSYLQFGFKMGLIRRLIVGKKEFREHGAYRAWYSSISKKYIVLDEKINWAGRVAVSDRGPYISRPRWFKRLTEINVRGVVYKNPWKAVPQLLLGALKKYHGLNIIGVIASEINAYMRKLCAHPACVAHVHDALVFEDSVNYKLSVDHKIEYLRGWSILGLIQSGEPPRHWGIIPHTVDNVLTIIDILENSETIDDVLDGLSEFMLFEDIIRAVTKTQILPGLVDLGTVFSKFAQVTIDELIDVFEIT
ncbi:MAG: hypothetical protein QW607_11185 [Desulfurococcaceae archaeon]